MGRRGSGYEATGEVSGPMKRAPNERGVLTTELAVAFPLILIVFILAVFASRVQQQNGVVQNAADSAARAAALHLDEASAQAAALAAAQANGGGCESIAITSFEWPTVDAFTPGIVVVEVTCTESMTDLGLVTSGNREVGAIGKATVEFWRPEP